MAQTIRSGYRDVRPTDFGAGSVAQDLRYNRQRKDQKADRDFQVKLRDQAFIDQTLMELSKEGVMLNDKLVEEGRDRLSSVQGDTNSRQYREAKNDILTGLAKSSADHVKFMESFQVLSQDMQKNPQYWKRESFAELQTALANRDLEAINGIMRNGKNVDRYLKDMMGNHIQMTKMYEDRMVGDVMVSSGGIGSQQLHTINDNGQLVNKAVEDINIEAMNNWANGIDIDPDIYRMLSEEAYERDLVADEKGDDFGKLTTQDQIKTILFERAFGYYSPQQDQSSGIRTKFADKTQNPSYFKWLENQNNKKNLTDWFVKGDEAAIKNRFEKYGLRLNFINKDKETGKYTIEVQKLVDGRRPGTKHWDTENPRIINIDPKNMASITAAIGGLGEDVGSASSSGEVVQETMYEDASGNKFTFEELGLSEEAINALIEDGDLRVVK